MGKYEAERFELQREYFNKALDRLHEALAENETPFVRDSIIQRFEMTFEMAWKSLYRYLSDKGEEVAAKAWDVLPVAFVSRLIADAELWDQMRSYRNDTSHEYKEAMAIEIAAFVRSQAVPAFEALRQELARRG
jgi:nucleotidyltransferase substrate binding protein (TIGR01987 family)